MTNAWQGDEETVTTGKTPNPAPGVPYRVYVTAMLQEPCTRETRPSARELKFLIPARLADEVLMWSRGRLAPDPHGSGAYGDEYRTASLYFDTPNLDVYHRRGSYSRSKYRIRQYGGNGLVFLERKLRTGKVLSKRRTPIVPESLQELESATRNQAWAGHWFRRRLAARQLRPVSHIAYHRVARGAVTAEGQARLTIDRDIVARPIVTPDFPVDPGGASVLAGQIIVEMKFVGRPPALFRELVEALALEPLRISKYRLSIAALAETDGTREPAGLPEPFAADVIGA